MYTIFGSSGFIGKELASYLKEKKQKFLHQEKIKLSLTIIWGI